MINIAEIIKRFPEDFEYYNILTGICTVEILGNDYIKILPGNIILNKYGQHSSFEASECILFPKKDQRDWELWFINSGHKINVYSRLLGVDLTNSTFSYGNDENCKVELDPENFSIKVCLPDSPYIKKLDKFGFSTIEKKFLKPSKESSYLDWLTYPEELPTGTLVFVADESENFKIGTYIKMGLFV